MCRWILLLSKNSKQLIPRSNSSENGGNFIVFRIPGLYTRKLVYISTSKPWQLQLFSLITRMGIHLKPIIEIPNSYFTGNSKWCALICKLIMFHINYQLFCVIAGCTNSMRCWDCSCSMMPWLSHVAQDDTFRSLAMWNIPTDSRQVWPWPNSKLLISQIQNVSI